MIERLYSSPKAIGRIRSGPLRALVDSYAEGMLHQGYTESTLRPKVRLVGALSQWMHARQIPTTALDEGLVASFLAYVATRRHIADGDRAALRQLLQHLRQRGVVPPSSPESHQSKAVSPIEQEYFRYLAQERGLSPLAIRQQVSLVRRFLSA